MELVVQGSYASQKLLKTLEFHESDFKALSVLEILLFSGPWMSLIFWGNRIIKYQGLGFS